jgi:two-component system response regulator AtoC
MAERVLIVDDEPNLRKVLGAHLQREGYEVTLAADGDSALELIEKGGVDVVVTDMVMPKLDGLALLRHVVDTYPDLPVIMITAHGTIDSAVEALKLGAFDYITKPFERDELRQVIAKAARSRQLFKKNASPEADRGRYQIIGQSQRMLDIYSIIAKVADAPSTVLVTGESGTGKELVAGALHANSRRKAKPFIKVNCAAIPHDLLESELFGHERGAFTGAIASKPGRFELADEGTLFLDEIGDIPVDMQVKLLRALQESEFERVGGIKTVHVDVRIVAATSRDLKKAIEQGRFREDLYYRLNVVPIFLPPLRERREDVPLLAEHFREKYNQRLGKKIDGFTPAAVERLLAYAWPGNIRELENLVERTLLFCESPIIDVADLPDLLRGTESTPVSTPSGGVRAVGMELPAGKVDAKEFVEARSDEMWRDLLIQKLAETQGNVTQAARLLNITRKTLQTKMKELGLREPPGNEDERD